MTPIPVLKDILENFVSVGLEDMGTVKFMDRVETKYVFPAGRISDLLNLMDGRYKVLEINNFKYSGYNQTYFDTAEFLFYYQHVTRRNQRNKVRLRQYESTGVTFLEVKKKTMKGRTIKWRIENPITGNTIDGCANDFILRHIPYLKDGLKPVLDSSFKRITFAGFDVPERITLDLDLSFKGENGERTELPYLAIAELKCDGLACRTPFAALMKKLSVYPTGFSKYCIGSTIVNDVPHKNILKPKLMLINRFKNEYIRPGQPQ